jgi:hypothetical protein
MGFAVIAAILIVSLAIGIAVQYVDKKALSYEWLIVFVTAAFGAYFFSETLPGSTVFDSIKSWGPQVDGFYLIPGIVGGAVLALIAYFGTRTSYSTTSAA